MAFAAEPGNPLMNRLDPEDGRRQANKAPSFQAADLLLPVVDLGQEKAYLAVGWTAWFTYFLMGAGLLLTTTAAAAIARRLRRTLSLTGHTGW